MLPSYTQPNRQATKVTSPPASEPVTLEEVKLFLKVDDGTDDSLITSLIVAAREAAENYLRKSLITQTVRLILDRFPFYGSADNLAVYGTVQGSVAALKNSDRVINLPLPPILSIASVKTYNEANTGATLSSSLYVLDEIGGRVLFNKDAELPTGLREKAAVEVNYTAGYGATASSVPSAIKNAIMMHVKRMYDYRTMCDMPADCKALLQPYKLFDTLTLNG